jgi:hypothetical protein
MFIETHTHTDSSCAYLNVNRISHVIASDDSSGCLIFCAGEDDSYFHAAESYDQMVQLIKDSL